MQNLAGKRIAVYARYSSDKQNSKSVDDQLRICREHVERNGGEVDDALVFMDAAISGKSNVRPGFQALQEACRRRLVDVVVTESTDRVGRDLANNAVLWKQLRSWGARLVAINDGVDTDQQGAKWAFTLKSLIGEDFLVQLGLKTKRGMDSRFEAGLATGGKTYGYTTVPVDGGGMRAVILREEAAIVRKLFKLYVDGYSYRAIAEKLNQGAERPPRVERWNDMTVRAMLANERYAGVWTFNKIAWERDADTGKRIKRANPRSMWRRKEIPELRIIDAATWQIVSERRASVSREHKSGRRKTSEYPLSGLLVCGVCNAFLTINGGKAGHRYYSCSANRSGRGCSNKSSIAEPRLRKWFLETFRDKAGASQLLDEIRKALASQLGSQGREVRAELEKRRSALATTQNQIGRLLDFIADGNDSPATAVKIKEKEDYADLQRAAILKLEGVTQSVPRIPSVEEIRAFLAALPQAVERAPVKMRQALKAMLVGTIACYPPDADGGVRVVFELDPEQLANTAAPSGGTNAAVFVFASCGGPVLAKTNLWVVDAICPK